jgi:uncharacterized protein YukE
MGDVEIPGSPGGLDALAGQLHAAAGDIGAVTNRVASNGLEGAWSGQAADAFRSSLHQLPGELGKVGTAFTDAAGAITQFAAKLAELQEKARWYNEHVANVEQELRDADARNEQAQTTLDKARLEHSLATDPVSLSTTSRAVSLGESFVRQAASDMEDAEGSLAQLISGGNGVRGEYESAVRVCCAALDAARDGGGSLLSGWRRDFDRMAGDSWHLGGTLWRTTDRGMHDVGDDLDRIAHVAARDFDEHWGVMREVLEDAGMVLAVAAFVAVCVGTGGAAAPFLLSALAVADSGAVFEGDMYEADVRHNKMYAKYLPGDMFQVALSAFGAVTAGLSLGPDALDAGGRAFGVSTSAAEDVFGAIDQHEINSASGVAPQDNDYIDPALLRPTPFVLDLPTLDFAAPILDFAAPILDFAAER